MSSTDQFPRRPYTGSCHCGHIKYIVYLSLPTVPYPKTTQTEYRKATGHRIYKCNCTICHKTGVLHIRPLDPANDFFVISPTNLMEDGSGYKKYVPNGRTNWNFCEQCGARPFTLRGSGYTDEVDFPTALLQRLHSRTLDGTPGEITAKDGEVSRVSVWRPKKDWQEHNDEDDTGSEYCSINAVTIDAHNDNFDLPKLHENGYVGYMQTLGWVSDDIEDKPYPGGAF